MVGSERCHRLESCAARDRVRGLFAEEESGRRARAFATSSVGMAPFVFAAPCPRVPPAATFATLRSFGLFRPCRPPRSSISVQQPFSQRDVSFLPRSSSWPCYVAFSSLLRPCVWPLPLSFQS